MVSIRAIAPTLVVFLVATLVTGSFALAATFGNQLPPGCQSEVSTEVTKGNAFHGVKCNSSLCLCSAFQCTHTVCVALHGGRCVKVKKITAYQQATCSTAPQ